MDRDHPPQTTAALGRRAVLALAWPIVAAQVATALTGVVDTAVMGRTGTKEDLAAVAVATTVFSFLYWSFGFLRMATTGQTAQARGGGRHTEVHAILVRALALGAALGVGVALAFPWLQQGALGLFEAPDDVRTRASAYMVARIGGAPAALTGFAVMGWLLGMGRTRALLVYQVVLNGTNAVLDAVLAGALGWGTAGIGAGTAMAEWLALGVGLWLVRDGLRDAASLRASLWQRDRWAALFTANRDILVRTLALLASFGWFVRSGSLVGVAALAGNQVLLQFITVSAFVLDAFAFVAEKEVGEAVGAGDAGRLARAIRVTGELSLAAGLAFSLAFAGLGGLVIDAMVADVQARGVARTFLLACAVVPTLGMPAWLLDGVFLGATRGRALRNAAVVTAVVYLALDSLLRPAWGNAGVWTAFLGMYVLRAGTLAVALPALFRAVRAAGATASPAPSP
ncbi:MAG: MATE family efflux transporter [Alphaproteobacteria bacterium]|nr:MATE family efflux transporter [Alphaproteobacteria bacterium]